MAIFDVKYLKDIQSTKRNKIINIALHSTMLFFCLVGSLIFIQDTFYQTQELIERQLNYSTFSYENIRVWIGYVIKFIKIKIIIPAFMILYFYYCITQKVFQKLFKEQYSAKYNQKYNKVHQIDFAQPKKSAKETSLIDNNGTSEKSFTQSRYDMTSKQPESSLNMSVEMVKSMSRSMMGSIKSMQGSKLDQSMSQKANLSMRSSKVIQTIAKKANQPVKNPGKDFVTLFTKAKDLSQSYISQSSSGIQADEAKIKIKAKKYFETINEKQGQQFKRWYLDAISKYQQQLKSEQDSKDYYFQLTHFKRGIQRQLNSFLKEYRENYDSLKECLCRFWKIRLQGYESKRPVKSGIQFSNLFKQDEIKMNNQGANKPVLDGMLLSQKQLLKRCSSARDFLNNLSQLKVSLRNVNEKTLAQKELTTILAKIRYLNILLNVSCIEGQLLAEKETQKIRALQKTLNLLSANKIDILSLFKTDLDFNDLDLFQEYDIETIKHLVELRTMILVYIVNKINLMSDQRHFKVKMNQAVTFDSGYLTAAMQFFKNKNFAEVISDKGAQNLFTHFNLKITKINQGQEAPKQILINCKPGLDNSISTAFFLVKELSENLELNLSFDQRMTYDQKRREKSLREFIQTLYAPRKF